MGVIPKWVVFSGASRLTTSWDNPRLVEGPEPPLRAAELLSLAVQVPAGTGGEAAQRQHFDR